MIDPSIGYWAQGLQLIAGTDEVGRGPLAGPVVAAAVILGPAHGIDGLADSKTLSPTRREALVPIIQQRAICWALGRAEVEEIDDINILHASLLAMRRAILALRVVPELVLVDGNRCPDLPCATEAVIKGDACVAAISAASIIAKVARDREMCELDGRYPGYGFAGHKGYSCRAHFDALERLGASPVHRRSFAPVRRVLAAGGLPEPLS